MIQIGTSHSRNDLSVSLQNQLLFWLVGCFVCLFKINLNGTFLERQDFCDYHKNEINLTAYSLKDTESLPL